MPTIEWNVKNALDRNVERQHLNKILADIRASFSSITGTSSGNTGNVKDQVGEMVTNNSESGISVTYDSVAQVLNFAVASFILTLTGDVSGQANITPGGQAILEVTIDPSKFGITDAPQDGFAHWRRNGGWELVGSQHESLQNYTDNGIMVMEYDLVTETATFVGREIEGTTSNIVVTNGDGISGNPTIDLADVPNGGDGAFLLFFRDAKGRVVSTTPGDSDDVPEGTTNLWFTDERAQDAVASTLTDTDTVLFTYDDGANTISAEAPPLVFGQEYLDFFHRKLIANTSAKMVFSGDSTTFGTSIVDPNFLLHNAVLRLGQNDRYNLTSVNAGHSGASTEDWRTLYLAGDIASNPDLYVLRWGFNDPFWGYNLAQFETALRTGLATIRATKSVAQMSILLMTPNTANDTPNGRDAAWFESTRAVVRKAAVDYQCAFIDTYKLWDDTVNAAGNWMDDPFADGRAIHPLERMNGWIASKIGEMIFPPALKPIRTDIHVTLSADQVFSTGTFNTLVCDTEIRDARGEYNPGTGVFTVQQSGKYLLNCSAYVDLTTQDRTIITMINVNGSEVARLSETTLYGSILATGGASGGTSILDLSAGDQVTFQTFVFIPSPSTYTVKNFPFATFLKITILD